MSQCADETIAQPDCGSAMAFGQFPPRLHATNAEIDEFCATLRPAVLSVARRRHRRTPSDSSLLGASYCASALQSRIVDESVPQSVLTGLAESTRSSDSTESQRLTESTVVTLTETTTKPQFGASQHLPSSPAVQADTKDFPSPTPQFIPKPAQPMPAQLPQPPQPSTEAQEITRPFPPSHLVEHGSHAQATTQPTGAANRGVWGVSNGAPRVFLPAASHSRNSSGESSEWGEAAGGEDLAEQYELMRASSSFDDARASAELACDPKWMDAARCRISEAALRVVETQQVLMALDEDTRYSNRDNRGFRSSFSYDHLSTSASATSHSGLRVSLDSSATGPSFNWSHRWFASKQATPPPSSHISTADWNDIDATNESGFPYRYTAPAAALSAGAQLERGDNNRMSKSLERREICKHRSYQEPPTVAVQAQASPSAMRRNMSFRQLSSAWHRKDGSASSTPRATASDGFGTPECTTPSHPARPKPFFPRIRESKSVANFAMMSDNLRAISSSDSPCSSFNSPTPSSSSSYSFNKYSPSSSNGREVKESESTERSKGGRSKAMAAMVPVVPKQSLRRTLSSAKERLQLLGISKGK
ncbi:unnamed protein product [Closterium sp. NIES-54]